VCTVFAPAPVERPPHSVTGRASSIATQTEASPEGTHGEWRLSWSDEFDGLRVDERKWTTFNNSTFGDGNNELACLTNREENVAVRDGHLLIVARTEPEPIRCGSWDPRFPEGRAYSSGLLESRGKASFEYGRFEIRAKTPTAPGETRGLWPAFWLRPVSGGLGEIDVVEVTGSNDPAAKHTATHTIHYDYAGTHPHEWASSPLVNSIESDGYHVFAAEWQPGVIRWFVDGTEVFERTIQTTSWLDEAFSGPFFLRINLAVGGDHAGSPVESTRFPATFAVDYVRVYERSRSQPAPAAIDGVDE
jgi:beta-glucanase (GH16 family)